MKIRKAKYENQTTAKNDLFTKIQPFLAPYRKRKKKLEAAIRNAFREIEINTVQPETLSMVFWKIFGGDSILWIDEPTSAGNNVPFDVMATAYAMWWDAQQVAFKRGLDDVDAAEAMTQVVHHIADRLADKNAPVIRNIRNYMFVSYVRTLEQIDTHYVGARRRKPKKQISDSGAFLAALENAILCDEILSFMPTQLREMAIFKYMLGYSFDELAAAVDSSSVAVRKAVSSGIRKAFGARMRDLHTQGHSGIPRKNRKHKKQQDSERQYER